MPFYVFGGGEAADTKAADLDSIEAQTAEISGSFSSTMRYRRIEMPNPIEALTVIGRDTLNYCCNYGEE